MENFVKLSALVNEEFTVKNVKGFTYKLWDSQQNKMLISDQWQKGYRKLWQVVTDKGQLDLGSGQMGNLLEAVMHAGKADIIDATFHVKSNGQQGKEIRYYLNPVKTAPPDESGGPTSDIDIPGGW